MPSVYAQTKGPKRQTPEEIGREKAIYQNRLFFYLNNLHTSLIKQYHLENEN